MFSRNTMSLLGLLVAAMLGLAPAAPAQADSATWNGTTDALWATTNNWAGPPVAVPGTGNTATFDNAGNANTTLDLGTGVTINTILFDTAGAAAYIIGSGAVGSQTLTLDNGGAITINSTVANNQTINAAVVLGNDGTAQPFTFTSNSTTNALTVAGGITGSTGAGLKTLTITGAGNTTLGGIVGDGTTGTVALTKDGAGTLTLTGANSYTGLTTVSAGVLNIQNATALGTTAAGTSVTSGAALQIQGGITVGAEALTLNGTGISDGGALRNISGTNTYGGLVTLTAPTVWLVVFRSSEPPPSVRALPVPSVPEPMRTVPALIFVPAV